jgi:cytochrome P450
MTFGYFANAELLKNVVGKIHSEARRIGGSGGFKTTIAQLFGVETPSPRRMMKAQSEAPFTLADVDSSARTFVEGVPHHFFKVLRREAPVYRHPEPDGPGFWAVTKYDDVVTISMDQGLYSSWRGGTNIADLPEEALQIIRMLMLNMDPPQHTKYRRLVSKGFTPKIVRDMEGHIRRLTTEILDEVVERGQCDFVTDVAAELPLQVILEMMGANGGPPPDLRPEQSADRSRGHRVLGGAGGGADGGHGDVHVRADDGR